MIEDAKDKLKAFWLWPWLMGAVLLSFRLNTYFLDDGPPDAPKLNHLLRLLETCGDALIYIVFFVSATIVHRIRHKASKPSVLTIILTSLLMLIVLKFTTLGQMLPFATSAHHF